MMVTADTDFLPEGTAVRLRVVEGLETLLRETFSPEVSECEFWRRQYDSWGLREGDVGHLTQDWEWPRVAHVQWIALGDYRTVWCEHLEIITP